LSSQPRRILLALALGLVILLSPSLTNLLVHAPTQTSITYWSPFGPREEDLRIQVYSTNVSELAAFSAGAVDIPDQTIPSGNCTNADWFCTTPDILGNSYVALNGWNFQGTNWPTASSLVSVRAKGFGAGYGFWSLLNMRQVPGSQTLCVNGVPGSPPDCTVNSSFVPGGGDMEFIRRGLLPGSNGLVSVNPFSATLTGELEVISLVYDTLLKVNPLDPSQVFDWMSSNHRSTFDSTSNVTTLTWNLRPDLFFHDGVAVTSNDVCYTVSAYTIVPSVSFGPASFPDLKNFLSCTVLNNSQLRIAMAGSNPSYALTIGSLPIIPQHIWAQNLFCGPNPFPADPCTNVDVIADDIFVGSGPWVCPRGTPNPSCSSTMTSTIPGGGILSLTRYDARFGNGAGYMRCCPNVQYVRGLSLQEFSWGDVDRDGYNAIIDVSNIAINYGLAQIPQGNPAYWAHPLFGCAAPYKVDICDVVDVARYFDMGLTFPYVPPNGLVGLDPQIDPFRVDTSLFSLYYLGVVFSGGGVGTLYLAVLGGTVAVNTLTVQLSRDSPDSPGNTSHSWVTEVVGPGAAVSGSPPGSTPGPGLIALTFTHLLCPAHYDLRIEDPGFTGVLSSDFDHIELGPSC
jgi:extracellular solute-binding protein (family 5)